MSEEAPRKRSRFDQTEPEPRKASRFDRRSRSPSTRQSETRSRSPLAKRSQSPAPGEKRSTSVDPAAAAAAAAAKINAELQARRGIQHVDVPPIRSGSTPTPTPKPSTPGANDHSRVGGDIYVADGDYIKDIEINDLRNRYTLTKGSTQKMIKEETGADVTTRGSYYPDKSMATATNPPLYLHVTSTSKAGLEKAIEKIEELMKQELPNLVDERRFRRREPEPFERDEFGRRKWPEEKIPIDMENIPGFNLRAQVVGQGGAYVKHIQQETGCRVQIKGRGSGFMEHSTGQESDEPMYLHVAGPQPAQVQKAKELCEDLLANVRINFEHFKANPPPQRMESYTDGYGAEARRGGSYGGHGHGHGHGQGHGHGHDRHRENSYSHNSNSYNSPYSATPATPAPGTAASPTEYAAQYAQYYASQPGGDPYAAYGGYQNYVAYYQYYQQQAAGQQQQSPPPPPPAESNPPPPPGPDSSAAAPPPPPSSGYSAVPPPPGL
ncbi:hypothetical protein HRR83_002081 [Exophiala dermatitidis]|uniref:K Homology domain-containing protein n=1 Tax=Exophiala dermatitidis TaxID=5970 RepID=A0AAN6EWK2_EXODE|nr:hypothetical protein HRR74_002158 [Exophiala dermatitidis]KAJ4525766.1 hypothetical protein HRR73_002498 [Exophiala dermatitidis]KAJ4578899.1 hypothetical protein HRR81_003049 [Exophiala dermatitidis]KAJ4603027.1 hypothetical protein HRR83_002081 [Exophiala dermatitidis]KAJ4604576.1 hypothetical protein HRR84_001657 [Exophiala dermatitidis]